MTFGSSGGYPAHHTYVGVEVNFDLSVFAFYAEWPDDKQLKLKTLGEAGDEMSEFMYGECEQYGADDDEEEDEAVWFFAFGKQFECLGDGRMREDGKGVDCDEGGQVAEFFDHVG